MVCSLINLIIMIIILVINEKQKCFGNADQFDARRDCIHEIKNQWGIYELVNTSPKIQYYAQKALLHLRVSDNPSLDSFVKREINFFGTSYTSFEDARSFFHELRQFITVGSTMLSPTDFCRVKHISSQEHPYTWVDPLANATEETFLNLTIEEHQKDVYTMCLSQLLINFIPALLDNKLDVLHAIYNNVVLSRIVPGHEFATEYVTRAAQSMEMNEWAVANNIEGTQTGVKVISSVRDYCSYKYTFVNDGSSSSNYMIINS